MVCWVFFLRENTTVNRCKNGILKLTATLLEFMLFSLLSCTLQVLFLPLRLCSPTLHGLLADCVTTWNLNECLIEVCFQELLSVVWVLSASGHHHIVGISVVLVYGT